MFTRSPEKKLIQLDDRGPLRVMFMITSMPVGGAETLLVQLVRRMDREHFVPEICCLKDKGPLGEMLSDEMTVHSNMLSGKFDFRVLRRLRKLIADRRIDAAAGDGADYRVGRPHPAPAHHALWRCRRGAAGAIVRGGRGPARRRGSRIQGTGNGPVLTPALRRKPLHFQSLPSRRPRIAPRALRRLTSGKPNVRSV